MLLLCAVRVVAAVYNITHIYGRRFGGAGSSAAIGAVVDIADGGSHVGSGLGGGAGDNAGANIGNVKSGGTSAATTTTASGWGGGDGGGGAGGSGGSGGSGSGGGGGNGGSGIVAMQISTHVQQVLVRAGVQVDVTVLFRYATLGLTSALMCINFRSVLKRVTSLFALLAGNDSLSGSVAIFVCTSDGNVRHLVDGADPQLSAARIELAHLGLVRKLGVSLVSTLARCAVHLERTARRYRARV